MNKQGLFYMFVSLVLTSAVLVFYFAATAAPFQTSSAAVKARVTTLNDFVEAVDTDLRKATYIAAYRSLIAMEEDLTTRGKYYENSEAVFEEAFYNGTIDGENTTILNASSLSDYIARVNQSARSYGAVMELSVQDVHLFHDDPWHISVEVNYSNRVADRNGVAKWDYTRSITREVPITALRDPIYGVGTDGRVASTIEQTTVTRYINDTDDANDTDELVRHANRSFYTASEEAPSYLMRFEGNFTSSTFGIESLVPTPDIEAQGLEVKDRSIVDHNYFAPNGSNASLCTGLINTPSWVKIDANHIERYEIDPKLDPDGYQC